MKILLTGYNGYIGRRVLSGLIEKNINVICLGRSKPQMKSSLIRFVYADLMGSFEKDVEELGASHLIHLAWFAKHGEFWNSDENANWIAATVRLLKAFVKGRGEHVTVSGTCAEYAFGQDICIEDETSLQPSTIYGKSKSLTSHFVTKICDEAGIPMAWTRIFLLFGGEDEPRMRLFPLITSALLENKFISVYGELIRDFLHVDEVADAIVFLALKKSNGIFNVGSGEATTIRSFAEHIAYSLNKSNLLIRSKSSLDTDQPRIIVADTQKLTLEGWVPSLSLSTRIQSIFK